MDTERQERVQHGGRAWLRDPGQEDDLVILIAEEGDECSWCGSRDYLYQPDMTVDAVHEVAAADIDALHDRTITTQGRTYRLHDNCVDDISETPWDEASARLRDLDDELASKVDELVARRSDA